MKILNKNILLFAAIIFVVVASLAYGDTSVCPAQNFLKLSEYQEKNMDQAPAFDKAYCHDNYLIIESNGMPT